MGIREIRHQVAKLYQRFLTGTVEGMPGQNQLREYDGRAAGCDWEKAEASERPSNSTGEVHVKRTAQFVSPHYRADVAGNQCPSASAVARGVLGPDSTAAISNVLVFGTEGSRPLKRMEIHLRDANEVPAILNSLAIALQRNGFGFRAVRDPRIPATEIWLTSPLHDEKETLLSCAAMVGVQVAQRFATKAGSRNQTQ